MASHFPKRSVPSVSATAWQALQVGHAPEEPHIVDANAIRFSDASRYMRKA
jgi:hypothetical protein